MHTSYLVIKSKKLREVQMKRLGGFEKSFFKTRLPAWMHSTQLNLHFRSSTCDFSYIDRSNEIHLLNLVTHEHYKSALKYFPGILAPSSRMTQAGERKTEAFFVGLLGDGVEWLEFYRDLKVHTSSLERKLFMPLAVLQSYHHFLYTNFL